MDYEIPQFDRETWDQLPDFLAHLPKPVRLHVWGDERLSPAQKEAAQLVRTLSERFTTIEYRLLPRRINFNHYPVFGVMGFDESVPVDEAEIIDYGVRLIGLPAGYQMTSLIAAIQCVSFQGMTSEARTRIQLHRLPAEVNLELVTAATDEAGTIMAQIILDMAVASPLLRSFVIMGDAFPDILARYSVNQVPHLIINSRTHVEGLLSEEAILKHIGATLKNERIRNEGLTPEGE